MANIWMANILDESKWRRLRGSKGMEKFAGVDMHEWIVSFQYFFSIFSILNTALINFCYAKHQGGVGRQSLTFHWKFSCG